MWGSEEGGIFSAIARRRFFGRKGGIWVSVGGVCEAGFCVGKTWEVEGECQVWDGDVDGGEGTNATDSLERGSGEIGTIGEVEICFWFVWRSIPIGEFSVWFRGLVSVAKRSTEAGF